MSAAAAEGNYGIPASLVGLRGFIGNVFAGVKFKCLLAAIIGRFGFEQGGKGEVVVRGSSRRNLHHVRKVVWSELFVCLASFVIKG